MKSSASPVRPNLSARERDEKTAALFRRYGPQVYSRCRRVLRDDALAHDATQEVFIRVLRHVHAAPEESAALPWLYRICTNYCLNQLRDQRRAHDALAGARGEGSVDFAAVAEQKDFARALMAQTPERLQAPALLHFVEGLKQAQVASKLGVCRRTVIYRLSRFVDDAHRFADHVAAA